MLRTGGELRAHRANDRIYFKSGVPMCSAKMRLLEARDCVVVEAVPSEPVSTKEFPCLTGICREFLIIARKK
jgi:hypothetical protein